MKDKPRHALIICNGEAPSRSLSRKLADNCDLVVAADGGANTARRFGIRPDVILGDLDSITESTLSFFRSTRLVRIRRQDRTDIEKAFSFVQSLKVGRVTLIGATGKRLDFTLGNLSVLWNYAGRSIITVAGDGWSAFPVIKSITMAARKGTTVSIIPFGRCSGIALRGLKYPLTNATMKIGEIGVSNVAIGPSFTVDVKRGKMMLVLIDQPRKHR